MKREKLKEIFYNLINLILDKIPRLKITPNGISTIGFVVGLIAAIFYAIGYFVWAGFFIIFSGIIDSFDGAVARRENMSTKFGAHLDSVLDRYVEFALFGGLMYYFRENLIIISIVYLALIGSIMVSYNRARASGLRINLEKGLMQRAERILLLALGSIINGIINLFTSDTYDNIIIVIILTLIAALSNWTAVHRTQLVKKSDAKIDG